MTRTKATIMPSLTGTSTSTSLGATGFSACATGSASVFNAFDYSRPALAKPVAHNPITSL